MRSILEWFEGRKTYLVAVGVILAVLLLVFLGRLTPDTALVLITVAVGLFGATFRNAIQRHHDEELDVLRSIAIAGFALQRHDNATVLKELENAAKQGATIADAVKEEQQG